MYIESVGVYKKAARLDRSAARFRSNHLAPVGTAILIPTGAAILAIPSGQSF